MARGLIGNVESRCAEESDPPAGFIDRSAFHRTIAPSNANLATPRFHSSAVSRSLTLANGVVRERSKAASRAN